MPPDFARSLPHDGIAFEVGEVKGGLMAMNARMGRMEATLDRGLADIKQELRGVNAAITVTTAPLDTRIDALELQNSERKGERGAWLGLASLIGGVIVAGSQWLVDHFAK